MEEAQSDRVAVIVSAALLDEGLTAAIQTKLHKDKAVIEKLFRPSGPLGSFSSKIDLGFAMGLYSKEIYADLVTIKNIRNEFAHGTKTKNLETQRMRDLCNNLRSYSRNFMIRGVHRKDKIKPQRIFPKLDKASPTHLRERYVRTCQVLLLFFGLFLSRRRPAKPSF